MKPINIMWRGYSTSLESVGAVTTIQIRGVEGGIPHMPEGIKPSLVVIILKMLIRKLEQWE